MKFATTSALLIAATAYAAPSSAAVLFDLTDDNAAADAALHNTFAGASYTASSVADGDVTLTTVAQDAPEYDGSGVLTGGTVNSRIRLNGNGVSINNESIGNTAYVTATGASSHNEYDFINANEVLTIEFDKDVIITSIDFFGVGSSEEVLMTIEGDGTTYMFGSNSGDIHTDPFGAAYTIAAGTDISFTISDADVNNRFSLTNIEVSVVPEPGSLALLGLGGLLIARRRRD